MGSGGLRFHRLRQVLEEYLDSGHIRSSVPQNNDAKKPRSSDRNV